jgi:hypothetical protein
LAIELVGFAVTTVTVTGGISIPAVASLVTWTIFSLGLALIGTSSTRPIASPSILSTPIATPSR